MICTAVVQIVARYGSDDNVLQIHSAHRLGDALWFVVFQREWFRSCHCTKSARARATVPGNHESSCALAPAFPSVRALCALANGVQSQIGNQRFGGKENRIRWQPYLNPRRLVRLVQSGVNFRARHRAKIITLKRGKKKKKTTSKYISLTLR